MRRIRTVTTGKPSAPTQDGHAASASEGMGYWIDAS
ncbi:hypothetical protein BIFADO_00289 [Bifidobacterium adolescentis L2-32]|uniref:Uncharacterized protein n=1 Tax=Bifidobacterium adolescentis L2-32 TaxID=411481 RepID=A7A3A0_BIFAD|nr:hypothetical protein BIFADO_00289 [Bifidobacterium adolescentis L2-32]